jgi:hypothetical protein
MLEHRLVMKMEGKKLSGNILGFPWSITWLYEHIEPAVGIVTKRSLAEEGGWWGGKDRCAVEVGRGRFLPNGNPNKGRQVLENGKLIPIMIPSRPLQRMVAVLLLCTMYYSSSIIQFRRLQLLFTTLSLATQRFNNKEQKQIFIFISVPASDDIRTFGSARFGSRHWLLRVSIPWVFSVPPDKCRHSSSVTSRRFLPKSFQFHHSTIRRCI